MLIKSVLIAAALASIAFAGPACASSTDWVETEGGRVRLVTSGAPDADGMMTGILDIDLRPGWKTYWRDPGDGGVPPSIDVSRSTNVETAEFSFPAPGRHDEGDFVWVGYDRPVALPIAFRTASGGNAVIDADIFLGVCESICIPVKAEFRLDPASDPDNAEDKAAVEAALAGLPGEARADFGVSVVSTARDSLLVEARIPDGAGAAELFIAATGDTSFGVPKRADQDGKVRFTVAVDGPDIPPAGRAVHYTLVTGRGAVSGILSGF